MGSDVNARAVCEAVLKYLDAEGRSLAITASPEVVERRMPAVDFRATGTGGDCAIEHTRIETFAGQLEDDHRLGALFGPLAHMLDRVLPADSNFDLMVAAKAVAGATAHDDIRNAITTWALNVAPSLAIGSPEAAPAHYRKEIPEGVPFEITLARWPLNARPNRVTVGRWPPEALETERVERIKTALEAKCPKLEAARSDHSSTMLIFENADHSLANPVVISEALAQAIAETDVAIPDEIFLVDVSGGIRVTRLR